MRTRMRRTYVSNAHVYGEWQPEVQNSSTEKPVIIQRLLGVILLLLVIVPLVVKKKKTVDTT